MVNHDHKTAAQAIHGRDGDQESAVEYPRHGGTVVRHTTAPSRTGMAHGARRARSRVVRGRASPEASEDGDRGVRTSAR